MNREQVLSRIKNAGILPVVRAPTTKLAERAVEALIEGGLSVVEITLTVPSASELISSIAAQHAGVILVGAGSVTTTAEALRSIEAGAQFIVSPGLNVDLVEAVTSKDIVMICGALTPTEVMAAKAAGADLVKIFPCSALGGPKYLKALRGPLPHVELVPTGGVNVGTVGDFVRAGAVALGVGSDLVDVGALQRGEDQVLTDRARALLLALEEARRSSQTEG